MIRKAILATVAAIGLSGCVTGSTITPAQVQAAAAAACGYAPTAAQIANLLAAGNASSLAAATTAEAIAQLLCAAVPKTARLGASAPAEVVVHVHGFAVTMRRVR